MVNFIVLFSFIEGKRAFVGHADWEPFSYHANMDTLTDEQTMMPAPSILQAATVLREGGLVAFPTETVYGLGVNAEDEEALARLYAVKGRPTTHPVIVHIASAADLTQWAVNIPGSAFKLAETFWPGPLTLILPRSSRVPDAVTGGQDTVGIRVPSHPVAQALLTAFVGGIAAPSANRFGRLSPTSAVHVQSDLGKDVDIILNGGACDVGVESTIVAFEGEQPVILRPGMITAQDIQNALSGPLLNVEVSTSSTTTDNPAGQSNVIRAPGTLAKHYAPRTRLTLVEADALERAVHCRLGGDGVRLGVLARQPRPESLEDFSKDVLQWDVMPDSPTQYAQQLYARLRTLDEKGLTALFAEFVPDTDAWAAVADRLRRAAHQS